MEEYLKLLSYRAFGEVSDDGQTWEEKMIVFADGAGGHVSVLDSTGKWWTYCRKIRKGDYEIQ